MSYSRKFFMDLGYLKAHNVDFTPIVAVLTESLENSFRWRQELNKSEAKVEVLRQELNSLKHARSTQES